MSTGDSTNAEANSADVIPEDAEVAAIPVGLAGISRPTTVMRMHAKRSDLMPRCVTPALQTRALTPILTEKQFSAEVGEWTDKLCGVHRVDYRSGGSYEGQWGLGEYHGKGIFTHSDGGVYDGEWFEGKRNGKGKQTWPDGAGVYEGDWDEDKRDGSGTHTNKAGECYEGGWKNNQRVGQGTCSYPTGSKYTGQWAKNVKSGKGVMTWPDGDSYDGQWLEDKMHGTGKFGTKDGHMYSGLYRKGKFIKRVLTTSMILGPKAVKTGRAPYGMYKGGIPA